MSHAYNRDRKSVFGVKYATNESESALNNVSECQRILSFGKRQRKRFEVTSRFVQTKLSQALARSTHNVAHLIYRAISYATSVARMRDLSNCSNSIGSPQFHLPFSGIRVSYSRDSSRASA